MVYDEKYNWLFDEMSGLKEKIVFRDKIIYKVNGKIHNGVGHALHYKNENGDITSSHYYIKGSEVTENEWNILIRATKIKKVIMKR